MHEPKLVALPDIQAAHERLKGHANKTPVMESRTINEMASADVLFKCENFQRVGAFKFRGAYNTLSQLTKDERRRGVITHSSGNHAQALALASKLLGIRCTVVMPSNSPKVKLEATRGYGAKVVQCVPTLESRESTTAKIIEKTGAMLIHPYDNPSIIAGAGTAAYELIDEVGELDAVFCPVGGGGLLSGTSVATKGLLPDSRVIGCEPAIADDACRSFKSGKLVLNTNTSTIADGLRTSLSELTFAHIQRHVDDIITVSEKEIIDAMRLLWERMKLVVEPSGAVSLAALLTGREDVKGKRVGVILSGGNIELSDFFNTLKPGRK